MGKQKANPERPHIDESRHVCYLDHTADVLYGHLSAKFGNARADELWARVNAIYEGFMEDLPFTGGAANPMAHSLYDSIAVFAYWEALPADAKDDVEQLERIVAEVFNTQPRLPRLLNANHGWLLRIAGTAYRHMERVVHAHALAGDWGNAWDMRFNEDPTPGGIQMKLVGCPLYDFAKANGYLDLMPAMCNPDYAGMARLNVVLVRPDTVSRGSSCCDYRFVGSRSKLACERPLMRDAQGFLYNERPGSEFYER